jgi:hypothetical protein
LLEYIRGEYKDYPAGSLDIPNTDADANTDNRINVSNDIKIKLYMSCITLIKEVRYGEK